MYTNVNLAAPLGVLLLLATGCLFFFGCLALIVSVFSKRFRLARLCLIGLAGIVAIYLGGMLVFSLASSEQVLARGQEKYFCEIDCHLAYSIIDIRDTKTLGEAANQLTATGTFRVVTVQTRFDETTISPRRGNEQLYPNPRDLIVVSEAGKKYFPSLPGQRALERSGAAGTAITSPLPPGESYKTSFVFDLPADVRNPTLLIHEDDVVTFLIIGHENSLLHKKTRFQI